VAAWQPYNAYGWMGGWAAMPDGWDPGLDAEKALTATIDAVFGEHRPGRLTVTVREGNAAHVLLEASRDAQLLVVGSRGHGGFTGMLLGSVSTACTEHASCPVLVVRGDQPVPGSPVASHAEGVSP
jgi:nucleotide-binding universal stress UspA family protein